MRPDVSQNQHSSCCPDAPRTDFGMTDRMSRTQCPQYLRLIPEQFLYSPGRDMPRPYRQTYTPNVKNMYCSPVNREIWPVPLRAVLHCVSHTVTPILGRHDTVYQAHNSPCEPPKKGTQSLRNLQGGFFVLLGCVSVTD